MSQIPRRSSTNLKQQRSSSVENVNSVGVAHMGYSHLPQGNRQSNGRTSSIGFGNLVRSSSIGRLSSGSGLGMKGEMKQLNTTEICQCILDILVNKLEYQNQPLTTKILLLPSTGLFYNLFEFLLKQIGIDEPIWNPSLLLQNQQQSNQNKPQSFSQPKQPTAIEQNKAKIELVIYYLNLLRYQNTPKAQVLQTMTTPKNWNQCLLILKFLCHDCEYLQIYDANKILFSFDRTKEIFHEYLKRVYPNFKNDFEFMHDDQFIKIKDDAIKRYESQLRGNVSLKNLEHENNQLRKQFEYLDANKNELDELLQEEQDLIRQCQEAEKEYQKTRGRLEDRGKQNKLHRDEIKASKEKLAQAEAEMAMKDAQYDKQLASGKQMDNLPVKFSQKEQELENLQNVFVELDQKKDSLHSKIMQRVQEIEKMIQSVNDLTTQIKLASSLPLDLFPVIEMLDFHKRIDICKDYKDKMFKIRESFNSSICKLHDVFSQTKDERQMMAERINSHQLKMNQIDAENRKLEEVLENLRKETIEILEVAKKDEKDSVKTFNEAEKQYENHKQILSDKENSINKSTEDQKKLLCNIKIDLQTQEQTYKELKDSNLKSLLESEKQKCKELDEFDWKLLGQKALEFLERIKADK